MIRRQLYLALDHKHAGIVTCVADSPSELAKRCGVDISQVSHSVSAVRKDPKKSVGSSPSGRSGATRNTKKILGGNHHEPIRYEQNAVGALRLSGAQGGA